MRKYISLLLVCIMLCTYLGGCGRSMQVSAPTSHLNQDGFYSIGEDTGMVSGYFSTDSLMNSGTSSYYPPDIAGSTAIDKAYSESTPGGIFDKPVVEDGEFNAVKEKSFVSTYTTPLSTFASDVDTASYTYFRGMIDSALEYNWHASDIDNLIKDIRVEEVLNYFRFDYGNGWYLNDIFQYNVEVADNPWNKDTKLLTINVQTPDLPEDLNMDSHYIILLDVSGSMEDNLDLVKDTVKVLLRSVTDDSAISLITYAGSQEVIFENESVENSAEILNKIARLYAGGGTYGEGGIEEAFSIAGKYQDEYDNTRIMIFSDGDFNIGKSSYDEVLNLIEDNRELGIYLSSFGFGDGNYSDVMMETIADNGNGSYHYIDSLTEAEKVFAEDIASTLVPLANDVKFQIEFNPTTVKGYRQIGYENRVMANEDFADDTKDGGEIGYNHSVTMVYELVMADSDFDIDDVELKYQDPKISDSDDLFTISTRYKPIGESESVLVEQSYDSSCISDGPSGNWQFIATVTGFALSLNDSDYIGHYDIDAVLDSLDRLKKEGGLDSKYKEEFKLLVERLDRM